MTLLALLRNSGLAVVPLLSLGPLYAQHALQPVTFRANAQMVLVPVTVTDRGGKTLDGLQAENFEILDDHMRQEIVSFASDDAPCSVGLVLDVSGSMRDTLGIAKNVTHAFFEAANPGDEFFLLTVSTQPDTMSGFSADTVFLEKTIESTRPAGMTALIDTVYLGLSRMRGAKRPRRALLILSDGMDNHSRYSKSELLRVALEADVQVYTIIVGTAGGDASGSGGLFRPSMAAKPWDQAHERQGPDLLEELSEKTGGLHFRVHDAAEAANAAGKAGRALRNEYVIGYQAPAPRDQGKWHRIRVKADVPHASVYARSGYFAP